MNSSNHALQEVSAWSGDNLGTIERNYWKKRVVAGLIDATLRGERTQVKQSQQIDDLVTQIGELLKSSKGSKNVRSLENFNEFMKLHGTGFKLSRETVPNANVPSTEHQTKAREVWTRAKIARGNELRKTNS